MNTFKLGYNKYIILKCNNSFKIIFSLIINRYIMGLEHFVAVPVFSFVAVIVYGKII